MMRKVLPEAGHKSNRRFLMGSGFDVMRMGETQSWVVNQYNTTIRYYLKKNMPIIGDGHESPSSPSLFLLPSLPWWSKWSLATMVTVVVGA